MFGKKIFKMKYRSIRWFNAGLYSIFFLISVLLILELAYRRQWIDFYQSEMKALNSEEALQKNNIKILVFGDSFSAQNTSYLEALKTTYGADEVINCAVPGTGLRQHLLFAKDRIEQYNPDIILYQTYFANDLIDYKHPVNWKRLRFLRNIYWALGDQFLVLQHINRKLGTVNIENPSFSINDDRFDPKIYNQRTKLYLSSNPAIYQDMFMLTPRWQKIFNRWKTDFKSFISICGYPPIYLINVPHCTEVSDMCRAHYIQLGATHIADKNKIIQMVKKEFDGITVIDPTEYFRTENKRNILYYQNDPHLNTIGQKTLGNFVKNVIEKK